MAEFLEMAEPILVDKPLGATPLQTLELLRTARPELLGAKLAYAGRLDPMACGLLPVLHSELLTQQETYWHLDKQYEATMLIGMGTDSHDLLGMAQVGDQIAVGTDRLMTAVQSLTGKQYLSVPVFSSSPVGGKAMFAWAREGIPDNLVVPVRRMVVSQLEVTEVGEIDTASLVTLACSRIGLVQGDFRQDQAIEQWTEMAERWPGRMWPLVRVRMTCSSGTYVRSLAHELGRRLKTKAMLTHLYRTRVGHYEIEDPMLVRLSWPQ